MSIKLLVRVTMVAVLMAVLSPNNSWAVTALTLTDPAPFENQYQQTLNSPCVVGDPSCNNPAGFGFGLIPPNTSPYDVTSPDYTVAQIEAIVGSTFFIGIDVNTTTHPLATEFLDFFGVYVNDVLTWVYDPATPGTNLHTVNNGNGYADSLLSSVDLSALSDAAIINFRAIVNTATDGREEFFLVSTTNPPPVIPEPASLLLLGTGLVGGAASARKRWKKS